MVFFIDISEYFFGYIEICSESLKKILRECQYNYYTVLNSALKIYSNIKIKFYYPIIFFISFILSQILYGLFNVFIINRIFEEIYSFYSIFCIILLINIFFVLLYVDIYAIDITLYLYYYSSNTNIFEEIYNFLVLKKNSIIFHLLLIDSIILFSFLVFVHPNYIQGFYQLLLYPHNYLLTLVIAICIFILLAIDQSRNIIFIDSFTFNGGDSDKSDFNGIQFLLKYNIYKIFKLYSNYDESKTALDLIWVSYLSNIDCKGQNFFLPNFRINELHNESKFFLSSNSSINIGPLGFSINPFLLLCRYLISYDRITGSILKDGKSVILNVIFYKGKEMRCYQKISVIGNDTSSEKIVLYNLAQKIAEEIIAELFLVGSNRKKVIINFNAGLEMMQKAIISQSNYTSLIKYLQIAEDKFKDAIRYDPLFDLPHYYLGVLYLFYSESGIPKSDNVEEHKKKYRSIAIKEFYVTLHLNAERWEANYALIRCICELPEESVTNNCEIDEIINKKCQYGEFAIKKYPFYSYSYDMLCYFYKRKKNIKKAIVTAKKSVSISWAIYLNSIFINDESNLSLVRLERTKKMAHDSLFNLAKLYYDKSSESKNLRIKYLKLSKGLVDQNIEFYPNNIIKSFFPINNLYLQLSEIYISLVQYDDVLKRRLENLSFFKDSFENMFRTMKDEEKTKKEKYPEFEIINLYLKDIDIILDNLDTNNLSLNNQIEITDREFCSKLEEKQKEISERENVKAILNIIKKIFIEDNIKFIRKYYLN
jgi:hypothetical protein